MNENFKNGFEKTAGTRSEALGSLIWGPASVLGGIGGILTGKYSKKDQKEANKKSVTNLIPGVGGYRLGRRLMGVGND